MNLNRRRFLPYAAAFITAPRLIGADGAVSLFNGRDLSGWQIRNGPESAFYVSEGTIAASPSSGWPAWLSTNREYENLEFSCEVLFNGWTDGGIYLNAPEHGRATDCGLQIKLFHQLDKEPKTNSMGSVFPVVAPKRADVHKPGEWNRLRILQDWPALRVWINGEVVQDLRLDMHPELSRRLRHGPIGVVTLGYPFRFRDLSVRELPSKLRWTTLFDGPGDMQKWFVSESSERAPVRFELTATFCARRVLDTSLPKSCTANLNCSSTFVGLAITTAVCCSALRVRGSQIFAVTRSSFTTCPRRIFQPVPCTT